MILWRSAAAAILRWLQNMASYRKLGRMIVPLITVRKASNADILIVQHWFTPVAESTSIVQSDDSVTNWVAYCNDHLAGFVQLVRQPDVQSLFTGYWLFGLYVKPYFRGLGIGKSLCQVIIDCARREGASTLHLLVREDNRRAIRLYRKLGFDSFAHPDIVPLLESELVTSGQRRVAMQKILAVVHE